MGTRKRHAGNQNGRQGESKHQRRKRKLRRRRAAADLGVDLDLSGSDFDPSDCEASWPGPVSDRNDSPRQKSPPTTARSGVSPVLVATLLILLITLTGGIYFYNFVDMSKALGTLQTRLATIVSPQSTPAPPATDRPKTDSQRDPASPPLSTKETPTEEATKKPKATYAKTSITNTYDNKIRGQLDEADNKLDKGQLEEALTMFDTILSRYPQSPRGRYGRALAIDALSKQRQSNSLLEQSITEYTKVLDLPDVPKELMVAAGKKCADRQTFRGWSMRAVKTLTRLTTLYPNDAELHNGLGISFLMANRPEDARGQFKAALELDPDNGLALIHIGFILKTTDLDIQASIDYLQRGLDSGAAGTMDGRFLFHLGDAYYRDGQHNKSYEVYKLGAQHGIFKSYWQRSIYNVDRLTSRPWWTTRQTGVEKQLKMLKKNWKVIREEGLAQLTAHGTFKNEDENLRETGDWKQLTLFARGRKQAKACALTPRTCELIGQIPEAAGCTRGQVKFSVMHPGTHVWPHCGPTNCRIRSHLGLDIPEGTRIRVTDETRTWTEGDFIIFDDSFEHEVWHEGTRPRLVLIVDLWHPELSDHERRTLSPI